MHDAQSSLTAIYQGWQAYQTLLIAALRPLSSEQLTLRLVPTLRSIGENTAHIIGARAGWFYNLMGEGGEAFADMDTWDRSDAPSRSAAELVSGLEATWQGMHQAIARWSPADWQHTYPGKHPGDPAILTRQWVIWHLIEHDLHHGGEISLTLGAHGLKAPDL